MLNLYQAIVDGDPPSLPSTGYSELAHDFVGQCLHKVPAQRPSYTRLINHPWLAELMQPPPTPETAAVNGVAGLSIAGGAQPPGLAGVDTADPEVAAWVVKALERKKAGKVKGTAKPALHAAPLDAVPASPEQKAEAPQ